MLLAGKLYLFLDASGRYIPSDVRECVAVFDASIKEIEIKYVLA